MQMVMNSTVAIFGDRKYHLLKVPQTATHKSNWRKLLPFIFLMECVDTMVNTTIAITRHTKSNKRIGILVLFLFDTLEDAFVKFWLLEMFLILVRAWDFRSHCELSLTHIISYDPPFSWRPSQNQTSYRPFVRAWH